MEVSKLSFELHTKDQLMQPMSKKHKTNLRKEVIKAYIRNKPTGTPIAVGELIAIAQYKSVGSGWQFVQNMVKRGELTKETIPKSNKALWSIPEDVHVEVPARVKEEPKEECEEYNFNIGFVSQVEDLAKRFSWDYDSDSLREFIKSLK